MTEKILVPALGESITEATISKWLKRKGDTINTDEPIVELETDKVNLEVPSPINGTLTEINYNEARNSVIQKEQEDNDLEKNREEYGGLIRQLDLERKFLEHLKVLMSQESVRTDTRESSVNIFQEGVK